MPEFPDLSHFLPQLEPVVKRPLGEVTFRRPTEADAAVLAVRFPDWRERREDRFPGRIWFRHFAGTSWIATADADQRPLAFLLGFMSPDHPGEAAIVYVGVEPQSRRKGLGRALVTRFEEDRRSAGADRVTAACRPDDRIALAFLGALGYAPLDEPGMRRLYGTPAHQDWDGPGEDRALLEHRLV